jgi:hypothetical protein
MHILFIISLAVLFPATHLLSDWLFDFANINQNISLIYLPAFLRLFNLLVLGPIFGTLATVLGGFLLMLKQSDLLEVALINIVCSSLGPLVALTAFNAYFKRSIQLTSLKDLGILTLIYCLMNSAIHHLVWLLTGNTPQFDTYQAVWMFIGDLNGALLGAYLMKALLDFLEKKGMHFSNFLRPRN